MNHTTIRGESYNVTDADSLKQTIMNVETRVKAREAALKIRLKRLPKESLKSATTMAAPAYLTAKMAGASTSAAWNLLKLVLGRKKAIFPLIGSVAKAGIFSMLKKRVQAPRRFISAK